MSVNHKGANVCKTLCMSITRDLHVATADLPAKIRWAKMPPDIGDWEICQSNSPDKGIFFLECAKNYFFNFSLYQGL